MHTWVVKNRLGLTSLICAVGLCILIWYSPTEHLLGFATLAVSWVVVLLIAMRDRKLRKPLTVGFLLRVSLVLIHTFAFPMPGSGADAIYFEEWAWLWAQDGFAATLSHVQMGQHRLYIWFISAIYSLTDRSPLMILGINVLFGTLIIRNVPDC